jgi:putative ABC transport system permease protein
MSEYKTRVERKGRSLFRDGWVWLMAWRDARHNFSRLFLFTASLVTGIAAVVSLDSLNNTIQNDIDANARRLLGADIVIKADNAIEDEITQKVDSLQLESMFSADMASMVLFRHNGQSRLIKLIGFSESFPLYGEVVTVPENVFDTIQSGAYAMLDESLASQYEVSSGDTIKLGTMDFVVVGVVQEIPGGGGILSTFTPSVYISYAALEKTGLIQFGSRVNYSLYLKGDDQEKIAAAVEVLRPLARRYGHGIDDVAEQKEDLGRAFQSIYRFFSLLAFVALILGCMGVASSVHIYAREKRDEVAVLRCVGSSGWQAFNIYFIQIFLLGIIGSLIGAFAGLGIQQAIPLLLRGVIPFEVGFSISWSSLFLGLFLGTLVSILFSVLPLVSVRFVPPLTVLRSESEPETRLSKTRVVVLTLIVIFPLAFAAFQTGSLLTGGAFFVGLLVALLLLAAVAGFLLKLVRKYFPSGASFIWRHALSNLFRPNNQTRLLMVTIGLGAFIISTLNVVEESMLNQVEFTGRENQSNTILFDIQPYQKDGVVKLMRDNNLPVNQVVPIVTCRLSEVNGRTIRELQADTTDRTRNWALTREYRVTYRDTLHHSEKLIEGEIQHRKNARDSVYITISEGMQENLNVKIGDSLVFDVQGVPVKAYISGMRSVDWPKDPPNFIFVFPTGVLEHAPQVYVTATRIAEQQTANKFQRELVTTFPNVSLIDLRLILATVNSLFDKLGLLVRFLALFSIATGLIVLAGAVINSKFVRLKENVLLRTVGARTSQITRITLIEYAYLGLFSALTGMILSLLGGWLLATFFFEITFAFDVVEMLIIAVGVMGLTVLIGWWNSREVIYTPPLQVLRKEG